MLDKTVNGIRNLKDGLAGAGELLDLAEMEDDEDTALAVVADVDRFEKGVEQIEFQRMERRGGAGLHPRSKRQDARSRLRAGAGGQPPAPLRDLRALFLERGACPRPASPSGARNPVARSPAC